MKRSLAVVLVCVVLLVVSPGLAGAQDYDEDCLGAVVQEMKVSDLDGKAWLDEANRMAADCEKPPEGKLLNRDGQLERLPELGCRVLYSEVSALPYSPILAVAGEGMEEFDFWLITPSGETPEPTAEDHFPGSFTAVENIWRAWDSDEEGTFIAVFERDDVQSRVRFTGGGRLPVMVGVVC